MNSSGCISDDRLKLLLVGELSDQEAQPLEQHLLECPSCVARTRSLQSADTLVSALQHAGGGQPAGAQSAVIDQLVQRLSDRSHLATHSSLLDETQAPGAKASAGVQDLVARLEPPAGPDELGRLGGFRVLKLLGQGGMGAVFLAEDIQLRRPVALKLLRPDQSAHTGAVERFMREARAAAMVRHDNVVTIYQVGQAQGMPFIAQELLEGETLEDRLKRDRRLPIGEALRIGREIASGLAAAHKHGLLHRDIKPSNVWLEGRVSGELSVVSGKEHASAHSPLTTHYSLRTKLLDFGLARHQQGDEQLTQSGAIVGTPAYMSPEQAQGRDLDARTDLFSLGGVLYRMLTGRLPFQGTDVLSILRSLAVDTPPPARSLNKEVPAELSNLIAELLQKDRDKRPTSAATVQARLAEMESSWGGPLAGPRKSSSQFKWACLLGSLAAALLIALGIFLTIKTPHGEITVDFGPGVKSEEVQIEVERNHEVKIADAKKGWTIEVKEGQYNVQLTGGKDKLEIKQQAVTVTRNKKTLVKVTLKPPAVAALLTGNPQSPIPSPQSPSSAGYALAFNGKDSYVDLPTLRYDGSYPITLEATIIAYPDQLGIGGAVLSDAQGTGMALQFPHDHGTLASFVVCTREKKFDIIYTAQPLEFHRRLHVAAMLDHQSIRLYVDGKLQQSTNLMASYQPGQVPLRIGMLPPIDRRLRRPFAGIIDEVRVSKMARYAANFSPPARLENDEHTLALYHFDAGAGDVLSDSSGHKHDGKIVNAKWVPGIASGPPANPQSLPLGSSLDLSDSLNAGFATVRLPAELPSGKPCTVEMVVVPRSASPAAEGRGLWALMGAVALKQLGDRICLIADTDERKTRTTISSKVALVPGRRVFLAGVSTGQELRLFVDGRLAARSRVNGQIAAALGHTLGGQGPQQFGWEAFDGPIDEIRISTIARYDRDYLPSERLEADEHTFALYHCDEGQGLTLVDSSGRGRDGKLMNAKWAPGIAGVQFESSSGRGSLRKPQPPKAVSPFTDAEAKAHQVAWAEHLTVPVEYTNSLGMKLRLIPPGEFLMGSTLEEVAELVSKWDPGDKRGPECIESGAPQHRVILTRPIYAGVLEVTQREYTGIIGANPAAFTKDGDQRAVLEKASIADTANFPVESVSWLDAVAFCQKLTIREKINYGGGYRLPTEAEWEFAYRAGTTSHYHSGDGEAAAVAAGWFRGNSGIRPHAGGELGANHFGLSDMHGNVWEWMLDRRDVKLYSRRHPAAEIDPQSLTSPTTERVLRGGNWRGIAEIGGEAFRDGRDEFHRHYDYGFRVWLPVDSLLASVEKEPSLLNRDAASQPTLPKP